MISNGTVQLGINAEGSLNFDGVGLANVATGFESTFPGCLCEGWGAGVSGGTFDNIWGGANRAAGNFNVNDVTFTSTANSARSTVTIRSGDTDVLRVVHDYSPSASPNLYEVTVTITNLTDGTAGAGDDGIRYRRVMDWDVQPTAFSEFVTIQGNGAENLLGTSNNGFATSNPFSGRGSVGGVPQDADFSNEGPLDQGALFDFGFNALAAGSSRTFITYYGTAATERELLSALASVGAEVYTLAKCNPAVNDACTTGGAPSSFAFGFKGVGGTPIPPPSVIPEPSTVLLLGSGLLVLLVGAGRRRRLV
ncbi:MAG TPA: PEP-CTERM sorting domain-containing protein [Gemmatimonadaceae bacterium]|nr:PEP-CTERM sorting domain-containing protein [Gemmatimonadaceae bacterium]